MSGIVSYGAYVPFNRIQRAMIGKALDTRGGKGERSVAGYDEDTVTMAVEAARACLRGHSGPVRALFFATTEPPYQEKLNAATIHAALNLPDEVRALDLGGSTRSGLSMLLTACDAAGTGPVLAAASDIRLGAPEGAAEQAGGDAAAAFVVGAEHVIAELEASFSETLEHLAMWRLPGELFAKTWEERFALTQVYMPLLESAAKGLLAKAGVKPADLAKVVLDSPNPRAATGLKALGLPPERFVDSMQDTVGHTGSAHACLMLAAALDTAKPGDRIAVLSVSDGVDAALFRVTDAITARRSPHPVEKLIASKRNDLSYTRFLKWRGILPTERPRRPDPARPAGPPVFRKRHWKFGFVGSECTACGARHLPPQRVCVMCGATDRMKETPFANETGTVATYTLDRLAYTLQPPMVMAMVDFEGGGRVELEITDCEPEKVAIGDKVEMTFRRLWTADGVHNYFWKARPVR